MTMLVWSLALLKNQSSIVTSCVLGHRCGLDLPLLWLWHRPATAAPIWPQSRNFHILQVWPQKRKNLLLGVSLWFSELTIWHCHCCGSGDSCGTISTPGPGTSAYYRHGQKKKKKSSFLSINNIFLGAGGAATAAYGSSQARDWREAAVAGLQHSHRHASSKPHLQPIP